MKVTNYEFIVNLSTGNTTPEFNVKGGDHKLPVNRMPMPLNNDDTITFSFKMGKSSPAPSPDSCSFYCWPIEASSNDSCPFYILNGSKHKQIINKISLSCQKPYTKILIKHTGELSFWEFALTGLFKLKSSGDSLIPFFVDPEAECSSGS